MKWGVFVALLAFFNFALLCTSSESEPITDETGDESNDIDDDLFYSDDEESEGEHQPPAPQPAIPVPPPPSIDKNDIILEQIQDYAEKRAFIELYARLPEPEPTIVQLRLTATPVSSSPLSGQPTRKSLQQPVSALRDSSDSKTPKSRAHRSAMFINPSTIPLEPQTNTTTTTTATATATSTPPFPRAPSKPLPGSPISSLTPLSTRAIGPIPTYPSTDSLTSSSSASPQSFSSSPRNSQDSIFSDNASNSNSPPADPDAQSQFSRMFAASVSKLLTANDLEEVQDPPIREGFLIKKKDLGVVRPWQRRYFLLRRDQLLYFVNKECRMKGLTLGIIPLNSVVQINPILPAKYSRFQLIGENGMNWYLQAASRPEMVTWLQALRKAGNVRNEEKLQHLSKSAGLTLNSLQKKEGEVQVRHKTTFVTRWIVLKDGILWEYSSKEGPLKAKIALYKCQLNEYQSPGGLIGQIIDRTAGQNPNSPSYSFQITTPTRSTIIRSQSAEQMHGWLNAILKQKVIVEEIIENVAIETE